MGGQSRANSTIETLSGNFVVEAAKGQFVKLDPGVGKLLGILSLQALPRRLTLDFRDIFSDGLAFDEIIGTVKVNRGVANTENFRIQGPAVRVVMSGDVDLNAETQKLRVKVFPSMSDSLSIAGALIGGPIAGIASFLVQKVLKDPLDQMVAYEYSVTGSWSDPQVVKVESRPGAGCGEIPVSRVLGSSGRIVVRPRGSGARCGSPRDAATSCGTGRAARARSLEQPAVRQALAQHLAQPGSRLVIHHGAGQEPLLQAEELRIVADVARGRHARASACSNDLEAERSTQNRSREMSHRLASSFGRAPGAVRKPMPGATPKASRRCASPACRWRRGRTWRPI